MYEEYFGLKRSPFKITPDTSLFYDGGHRGDILGALVYAVHRGEGIIKVVGEVGSGKTMLCRMLQLELPDSIEIIYIANPSVSPEDILFVIASELKFDVARNATKHELVSMLHHYLLEKHAENKQVVLFVEEAQGMPLETLEEIRLLSNLETDQHKLLQMILFGQPELDDNLSDNSIRQLRERITHEFNLNPLTGDDIHQYLNFRMREVGYTGPELISKKLSRQMAGYSEGLLRRINILSDKMLLSAFAEGTHTLTTKHLLAAVNDSSFNRLATARTGSRRIWWVAGAVVLLLLAGYAGWQGRYYSEWMNNWKQSGLSGSPVSSEQSVKSVQKKIQDNGVTGDVQKPENEVPLTEEVQTAEVKDAVKRQNQSFVAMAATEVKPEKQKLLTDSKKNKQSVANLANVDNVQLQQNNTVDRQPSSRKVENYQQWLDAKIESSKQWLRNANKQNVSIQVLMRNKSAGKELVSFLNTDWPLELDKTYLYEVSMNGKQIYRVFYDEFPSITLGQIKIKQLPESVRVNSPYLHSIYRMQKALL